MQNIPKSLLVNSTAPEFHLMKFEPQLAATS